MALSLKKNFGFALIGNLGYAASQYLILLIFIKLFPMEDVGQFIYAGAFTTPLMLALEMQLRNFYITDNESELSFVDYTIFRVVTATLGVIVLGIVAYILKPEFLYIILVVALIKSFESQLDLLYGVYQKNHQLDYVAKSRIIRGVVAILVVTSLSIVFKNILISLIGYLASWFLLYFFYERKQVIRRGFLNKSDLKLVAPNWKKMKLLIGLCLPMFLAIFIDKYYLNYPRISVEKFFGVEALAIFGSLLYFKSLGGQFISSLAQAAIPKMADFVKNKAFTKLNGLLFKMIGIGGGIGLALTIFLYFFGEEVLTILYTKEYAKYTDVLTVILLGTTITFSYIFIGTALTCIRKQWVKLPISILSFVILFSWVNFSRLNGMIDIALIVLYVEIASLFLYFIVYFTFIKRLRYD
ncbi:MATE family efflux transporter [Sphingobacterium corticibacterium]|uniref:Polysaccharide biosynthesis protein n=1 Tax=Sphingobacterium corticibacterium TaxID=2484746 RepID=A0A4Q6XH80_9SPHI|nr:hypothetical protein [Sphingobacterium corticibacterium]RZF58893.1 hypothetical protein EWE74_16355 [Sphingobacterium corticibacterium]